MTLRETFADLESLKVDAQLLIVEAKSQRTFGENDLQDAGKAW